ncbi:GNAT family N-acetyltransferase [Branchiibius cervicis]|uniref:GNAT family N-acetyltransferase n=1 Tax=Branchiibius cervicis TaxID=908252 RepID=A0ABW2AYN6_9MICO
MQIRPARRDEAATIADLVQSAYRGDSGRRGWTSESDLLDNERIGADAVGEIIDGADSVVLVGQDGERLIACAELRRFDEHTAYFGMFAVDPDRQNSGTGRELLTAAELFAQQTWHADTMRMQVIDVRTELIDWYHRRGYRTTDELIPMSPELLAAASRPDLNFAVITKALGPRLTPITAADRAEWEPLWQGYLEFYEEQLPDAVTDDTFARLVADRELHGVLARDADGTAIGFVHWLFHASTWTPQGYCYLEDLFVSPDSRAHGTGAGLIAHVVRAARDGGAAKVYWLTQVGNSRARSLYDKVATDTGFVHYEIDLGH